MPLRSSLGIALGAALCIALPFPVSAQSDSSQSPAQTAPRNPATARIAAEIGTWACEFTTPGGTRKEQVVWEPFGDGWMHSTRTVPAEAGRPEFDVDLTTGYDPGTKAWIEIYASSLGEYGIAKSSDAPDARTITYTDAFPVDPNDGPSSITMTPTTTTIDSTYTADGKTMSYHTACTKE